MDDEDNNRPERLLKLEEAFARLMDKIMLPLKLKEFQKNFVPLKESHNRLLLSTQKQFEIQVRKHSEEELQLFIEEERLHEKLKLLEGLNTTVSSGDLSQPNMNKFLCCAGTEKYSIHEGKLIKIAELLEQENADLEKQIIVLEEKAKTKEERYLTQLQEIVSMLTEDSKNCSK